MDEEGLRYRPPEEANSPHDSAPVSEIDAEQRVLALRDLVYKANLDEIRGDDQKASYWRRAVFELLDELKAANSGDFQTLLSQIEEMTLSSLSQDEAKTSPPETFELLKNNDYARLKLVQHFWGTGAKKKAIETVESIIKTEPKNAKLLEELGILYSNSRKKGEAVKVLEQALALSPDLPMAAPALATLYTDTGQKNKAIQLLERSVEDNPRNLGAKHQLARLYVRARRYNEAISYSAKFVEENPSDISAKMLQVSIDIDTGHEAEAVLRLKSLTKQYPQEAIFKVRLLRLYIKIGDDEQTINYGRELIAEHAEIKSIEKILLGFLSAAERKGEVAKLLEEMLKTDPQNQNLREQLAQVYWEGGRKEDGLKLAEANYRENPKNFDASLLLARFRLETGNKKAVAKLLTKTVEDNPENITLKIRLVRLYLVSKEHESAEKLLKDIDKVDSSQAEYFQKQYLWIRTLYEKGDLAGAAQKCIDYLQSPHAEQKLYDKLLPTVVAYLYKINPNLPIWKVLGTPEMISRLKLPTGTNLEQWIRGNLAEKGGLKTIVESADEVFTSSGRIHKAPYLIPINRAAKQGVKNYGYAYREQGTKIPVEKPKLDKAVRIDPETGKKSPG